MTGCSQCGITGGSSRVVRRVSSCLHCLYNMEKIRCSICDDLVGHAGTPQNTFVLCQWCRLSAGGFS